jgi:hypothetical protein
MGLKKQLEYVRGEKTRFGWRIMIKRSTLCHSTYLHQKVIVATLHVRALGGGFNAHYSVEGGG